MVKFLPSDVNLYSLSEIVKAYIRVFWGIACLNENFRCMSTTPDFNLSL